MERINIKEKFLNRRLTEIVNQDVTKNFDPGFKQFMILDIEKKVLEWLHKDDADSVITFTLKDKENGFSDLINFSRSEIFIKSCLNQWQVWRIATSCNYPEMISYKVKTIGLNDYDANDIMPNEILTDNYGGKINYLA